MKGHDIIVIGASAGGVQALMEIARGLPVDLPAAVFVVVHTSPASPGILPEILDRAGPLPCAHVVDGERIRPGRIYVAPPDHHLLLKREIAVLTRGPRENGFRPAVDPLFRTAARSFGPRVIGVILSGGLDDGTDGLLMVKRFGGVAVVQDPAEACYPSMPASAVRHVDVEHVEPVAQIAAVLVKLAKTPVPAAARVKGKAAMANGNGKTMDVAEIGNSGLQTGYPSASPPSGFTCPECGGALWEMREGKLIKFRCHVGHGYSAEGLAEDQARQLEAALWTALRALEESAALRRRMARRSSGGSDPQLASEFERQAVDAEERAALIRQTLLGEEGERHAKAAAGMPRTPDPVSNGPVVQPANRVGTKRPAKKVRTGVGDANDKRGKGKAAGAAKRRSATRPRGKIAGTSATHRGSPR